MTDREPRWPDPVGLVAVDVDGTLIERDTSLPPTRAEAFARLVSAVPTMLATGKTAPSIAGIIEEFRPAGPHAICNGAALVHADGGIEVLAALDDELADHVVRTLAGRGIAAAAYLDDGSVLALADDPRFEAITRLGEPAPRVGDRDGRTVLKVLSVLGPDDEDGLRDLAADEARVQRTGPQFLEWNSPAASKGHAVAEVARRIGTSLAHVVAIGDSENDVPMLEATAYGVAVADSSDAAVAVARVHLDEDVATVFDALARRNVR